eukprot:gene26898-20559_t
MVQVVLEADMDGCQEVLKLNNREAHEGICGFAPVRCPNSPHCKEMQRRELAAHLEICTFIRCKHQASGCTFSGNAAELKVHEAVCPHSPGNASPHSARLPPASNG